MIFADYAAFNATPVATEPFTHVVVENFVPPAALAAVVRGLPKLDRGGSFPIGSLRLGAQAQALMDELEGPEFREAVARKFDLDLEGAPTILLYLNPETEAWARREGCLRLLRGPDDIEDYAVEVPPVNGTLLVFPNGPTTWHGHKQFVGTRYVIQLNYMTTDSTARSEMRRHKVSAFVKRLTMAS
jgi:SM-20-related protein